MVDYVLMQKVQKVIQEGENSNVWQLNVTSWAKYQSQDLK